MRLKLTNHNRFALIDAEDAIRLIRHNWYLLKTGYVGTHMVINGKETVIYLHRFVMRANRDDSEIDHRSGNKLDCRKKNLRFANRKIQSVNSNWGKLRGVYHSNARYGRRRWQAYIKSRGRQIHLGTFLTKNQALKVRKEAELKYFGELCPR